MAIIGLMTRQELITWVVKHDDGCGSLLSLECGLSLDRGGLVLDDKSENTQGVVFLLKKSDIALQYNRLA